MQVIIKGGKVVNDDAIFESDVIIGNGKIREIGKNLPTPFGARVINAEGMLVMPGGIDPHTHFQFPFMGTESIDDFYSGTRAALAGGTTTIIDFAIDPESSPVRAYEKWRQRADGRVNCDYGLHVAILSWSDETTATEMKFLVEERGVNSFKIFMAYKNMQINDSDLLKVFKAARELGAIVQVHAENGSVIAMKQEQFLEEGHTGPEGHLHSRPEEIEAEATNRAIVLANQTNCPLYVVHVMSKSAAEVVAKKRHEGCLVFGEVIAAALGTDGRHYFHPEFRHAAAHIMSPPLRDDPSTPSYLMDMLQSDGLQVTGSDHCTFTSAQKALGKDDFSKIPNGVNGVGDRMSVIWEKGVMSGKLHPCRFVAITSTNAAKIFNIYPQKGRIQVDSDADIVVWDPREIRYISAQTHKLAVDFNIFEGMKIRGVPKWVFYRGDIVVENGELSTLRAGGRFLPTPPYSPNAYGFMQQTENEIPKWVMRDLDDSY